MTWNANETVSFAPQKNDAGTSAVLVLSLAKARDFDLTINATTVRQLKTTPEKWVRVICQCALIAHAHAHAHAHACARARADGRDCCRRCSG